MRLAGDVQLLDPLTPSGRFAARVRSDTPAITGQVAASLGLAPPLLVNRTIRDLNRTPSTNLQERLRQLRAAGHAFLHDAIDGVTRHEYEQQVCSTSGLPISTVRRASLTIAERFRCLDEVVASALPRGAVLERGCTTSDAGAVWVRRGQVLAVLAAGNHPAVHVHWLEAVALGWSVAVRPSSREPFTAARMVRALQDVGLADAVAYVPTDHATGDEMVRRADAALAYGGEDVAMRYAANKNVLVNGPGRAKILITRNTDWRDHLEVLTNSVCHGGGTSCVNATAIFIEGDPRPLATEMARRFRLLPSLPPQDEHAVLPAFSIGRARAIADHLRSSAAGIESVDPACGQVDDLEDGSAVLRPAVHVLDNPDAAQAKIELPFPCVWIVPWTREAGLAPLRSSLAITALTTDEALLDQLIAEPTIGNVHIGDHPTYQSDPGLPHDGYLADFLMKAKTVIGPCAGPRDQAADPDTSGIPDRLTTEREQVL